MPSKLSVNDYDLFAPEALLNPYPLYQKMRSADPVYFDPSHRFWVVTRYADVVDSLRDHRLSSDHSALFTSQLGSLDLSQIPNFMRLMAHSMIEKDPPEHTQMRKVASQGFTGRALESWRSIIQKRTDELLDQVQERQEMDIVKDFSIPLPAYIISEILGVPEQYRDDLVQWSIDIGTFWGSPATDNIEVVARQADRSSASFIALINRIIEERCHHPGTDLISLLIAAYGEHELSLAALPSLCILILNAGHLTTTDLIPNGVHALLTNPDQLQKLKAHPDLMASAVEEMIRFDTPAPFVFRSAKESLFLGGKDIPAGSIIALGIGAANHDPEKFANPEQFDIGRSPNEHIGFGAGVHFCLGAILARMELTISFATLLYRMPNLRLHPDRLAIPRHTSLVFKGFDSLPVKF